MSPIQVDFRLPDNFDNTVRLFPLPNLVLFPGVVQALHIFEPRYREMLEDSLAADRLIAMALLQDPVSENSIGLPPISRTVCIGRVMSEAQLEDGRYNLLLVGIRRARVEAEEADGRPYRVGKVQVLDEILPSVPVAEGLRVQLLARFDKLAHWNAAWDDQVLSRFHDASLPLARLVDMICYTSGVSVMEQQRVLETLDIQARAILVMDLVEAKIAAVREAAKRGPDFPPGFSLN